MSRGDMLTGAAVREKFVIVVKWGEKLPKGENVAINVGSGSYCIDCNIFSFRQFSPPLTTMTNFFLTAPPVNISPPDMLHFLFFIHCKEITPNLRLRCSNVSLGSGLVNISAIYL